MRAVGDKLQVMPAHRLSLEEMATIRQHQDELLRLVRYDADAVDGVRDPA